MALMERECAASADASRRNRSGPIQARPWNTFCTDEALRRRHSGIDYLDEFSPTLLSLYDECRDTLQAASNARLPMAECRYERTHLCTPLDGCVERPAPAAGARTLSVPVVSEELFLASTLASMDRAPAPVAVSCRNPLSPGQIERLLRLGFESMVVANCRPMGIKVGRGGGVIIRATDSAWSVGLRRIGTTRDAQFSEVDHRGVLLDEPMVVAVHHGVCRGAFDASW